MIFSIMLAIHGGVMDPPQIFLLPSHRIFSFFLEDFRREECRMSHSWRCGFRSGSAPEPPMRSWRWTKSPFPCSLSKLMLWTRISRPAWIGDMNTAFCGFWAHPGSGPIGCRVDPAHGKGVYSSGCRWPPILPLQPGDAGGVYAFIIAALRNLRFFQMGKLFHRPMRSFVPIAPLCRGIQLSGWRSGSHEWHQFDRTGHRWTDGVLDFGPLFQQGRHFGGVWNGCHHGTGRIPRTYHPDGIQTALYQGENPG